jgi:threonine aldolase
MGGTLYRLTPYAAAALVGLRDALPRMGEYVGWARDLAAELVAVGFRVTPDPPHTNTFLVHAEGSADSINERLAAFMERERVAPCGSWWDSEVPGFAATEIAVQATTVAHDPARVAAWWSELRQS